jgi:MFS family permease
MRDNGRPAGFWARIGLQFKVTLLGFAISALWLVLNTTVMPLRVAELVDPARQSTYLGLITFLGLFIAMFLQPVIGVISDRSTFHLGRRRPFIIVGVLLAAAFLPGIGLAGSFAVLGLIYCLLQVSSNIAQAPFQGLIPDLVPQSQHGRASGMKNVMEVTGGFLPMMLSAVYFLGRYEAGEGDIWLWYTLGMVIALLLGLLAVTLLTVKETPGLGTPKPLWPALRRSFQVRLEGNYNFVWFISSRFMMAVPFLAVQRFGLYMLRDYAQVANPATATGYMLGAVGIGLLPSALVAGYLSDRIGRRPLIVAAAVIGIMGLAALFFAQVFWLTLVGGGLLGVAYGAFAAASWALGTDLVNPGEEAKYLGLTNLATTSGGALVALMGFSIDSFNATLPGLGYQVMLGSCALLLVGGALTISRVRITPQLVEDTRDTH